MQTIIKALVTATLSLVATAALADNGGISGRLVAVSLTNSSSDLYSHDRGTITVDEGSGIYRKYVWGGQACSGRNLTDGEIAAAFRALEGRETLVFSPTYKPGGGGARCLTKFMIHAQEVPQ